MGYSAYAVYALIAVSTAVTVYSQVEQGKQAADEAEFNARVAQNNAAYDQDAAMQQAEKIRKIGREQEAEANAAVAGSGVKLGEGTPVDITRTIHEQSEADALSTILTGKRAVQSGDQQADLLRARGANAKSNSYIGAGATILGAASKAYGYYGTTGNWKTAPTQEFSGKSGSVGSYT